MWNFRPPKLWFIPPTSFLLSLSLRRAVGIAGCVLVYLWPVGTEKGLRDMGWERSGGTDAAHRTALCFSGGDQAGDKHWLASIGKIKTSKILVEVIGNIFFLLFQFCKICKEGSSTQIGGMLAFPSYVLCSPQDTLGDFPKRSNRVKCSPLSPI